MRRMEPIKGRSIKAWITTDQVEEGLRRRPRSIERESIDLPLAYLVMQAQYSMQSQPNSLWL